MKRIFLLLLLAIFFIFPVSATSSPLDIDLKKTYKDIPEISGFKYWYGSVQYGFAVYLGEDLSGFETEIQLEFSGNKISKAILILGPGGINDDSCVKDYRKVIRLLNEKYGHYSHQTIEKDPIINDLIAMSPCAPVRNELYKVNTIWKLKELSVVSTLVGDDDGYYIEIEYITKNDARQPLKDLKRAL